MYKYIILSALLLGAGNVTAQNKDEGNIFAERQQYLINNLSFYYVPNPNAETGKAYKLDNQAIASGEREGPFWEDTTLAPLPQLVEKLICKPLGVMNAKGDEFVQEYAVTLLKILDKPVQVWLYNDNEPLEDHATKKYNPCEDLFGYVWPCANTFSREEKEADFWAGYMHLGATNITATLDPSDSSVFDDPVTAAASTFLHMLMHTQDQSDLRAHVFHPYLTDKWFETGEKEKHLVVEAAPTLLSAYREGIANIYAMEYQMADRFRAYRWLIRNGHLLVATDMDSSDTDFTAKISLYHQIKEVAGEGDHIPDMPGYRGYKIRDLPPRFIIHNEIIIGLIFSSFSHWVNLDEAIRKTHAEMADPKWLGSPLATLFKYACEAGLPEGETVLTALDLPETNSKPYLIPLAYADFHTLCKARSKSEFSEIFGGALPQPWIDLYWDTAREKVRKAVLKDDGDFVKVDIYYEWLHLINGVLNIK